MRVQKIFSGESRTIQSERDNVDINTIVRKANLGIQPVVKQGWYGDVSDGISDYAEFCNLQNRAQSYFNSLPATVRKEFNYDVGMLVQALADKTNMSMLVDLGILKPQANVNTSASDMSEALKVDTSDVSENK